MIGCLGFWFVFSRNTKFKSVENGYNLAKNLLFRFQLLCFWYYYLYHPLPLFLLRNQKRGLEGKFIETGEVMDGVDLKETDSDFDLESAETDTTSGEDMSTDSDSSDKQPKKLMGRLQSGRLRFNGSTRDGDRIGSSKNVSGSEEDLDVKTEESRTKEKHRKTSSKKHPKPPRPPTGPSLNADDIKLVEEISEHARLRRARRQRIKELKEKRADKVSSPNINLIAMAVTIIFCFVIILQGILGSRV